LNQSTGTARPGTAGQPRTCRGGSWVESGKRCRLRRDAERQPRDTTTRVPELIFARSFKSHASRRLREACTDCRGASVRSPLYLLGNSTAQGNNSHVDWDENGGAM